MYVTYVTYETYNAAVIPPYNVHSSIVQLQLTMETYNAANKPNYPKSASTGVLSSDVNKVIFGQVTNSKMSLAELGKRNMMYSKAGSPVKLYGKLN